ncbi:LPPG domain protein containing protein [Methanocaldococcus infernus ME]|uniref:2-phospho-L-lactate transferase n=1 Tax=Methanocaldococcus infernus (strain DSM 11812 / JCM 15783 / ME) TaxID=573063 RepID=D5VRP2_METIM|nr:2-phospho-L-lactate transferase [Methanocaldococcus infernus]ADG13245.1 LPPG domain protein containing protein [Methanocaldococcus infernus ME]
MLILSGGTGTPKLLQGLKELLDNFTVLVNTGEDLWLNNLYVSPDVDTVLYTLSDLINEETWYGVRGDTFHTHEQLKKLGVDEFLRIGDKDRALKIQKTLLLNRGYKLSEAIEIQRKALGVKYKVLPMTDDRVETKILANIDGRKELLKFHDFWIKRKGEVEVLDVIYENSLYAKPPEEFYKLSFDKVIIGPSNPITSIFPILSIEDIKKELMKKKVLAVSPFIGSSPISGPAGKLMKAKGYESSAVGVYQCYKDFLDILVIDEKDKELAREIGCEVYTTNILMKSLEDKIRLAKEILELL